MRDRLHDLTTCRASHDGVRCERRRGHLGRHRGAPTVWLNEPHLPCKADSPDWGQRLTDAVCGKKAKR